MRIRSSLAFLSACLLTALLAPARADEAPKGDKPEDVLVRIAALAPQMKKRKAGRVVNVGSVAAFTGHPDLWYGVTKAGILNMTKAWAKELGPHGVLVNAVAPGPTQTAMYEQLPQSRKDGVMRSVYSGRVCQPEEVAAAILWLGSSCPEYVNGTTLDVNNGSYPR